MNLLERELHYPMGDRLPVPGEAIEVAPGIRWIRMGLPFALDHVNIWLLRDELDDPEGRTGRREGWTVVDCCIASDASRAQWEQIFATQLEGLPILRVIVTHMHPDHIGLADWICRRWNAPMWISATDFHVARGLTAPGAADNTAGGDEAADFFASHGLVAGEAAQRIRERTGYYRHLVPSVPRSFVRLLDGGTVTIGARAWRCIDGHGHAPEHIAMYCEEINVLIAGDMMLPRISTNVSVFENEPEGDPLTQYLDSLDRMLPLPADCLVLPSHGRPFVGLHTRIRQLHDHHETHFAEVLGACREAPQCANDLLMLLFKRKLDLHQTTFAMGESIAHLNAMWHAGTLARTKDAQGVWRFSPA